MDIRRRMGKPWWYMLMLLAAATPVFVVAWLAQDHISNDLYFAIWLLYSCQFVMVLCLTLLGLMSPPEGRAGQ